jgi:hypothetical protein
MKTLFFARDSKKVIETSQIVTLFVDSMCAEDE